MTKHRWKGSMKALGNHINPEKDEELKWMKIGKLNSFRERHPPEHHHHQFLQTNIYWNWRIWETALKPKRMQFKAPRPLSPAAHEKCYCPEGGFLRYTEWQLIHKMGNKVKKILKLARNMNPGNKDGNVKKKGELIHLIEDFSQQYESLCSLYEDLRVQVKKKVKFDNDSSSSSSSSDSDQSYYSPQELSAKSSEISGEEISDYQEGGTLETVSKSEVVKTKDFDQEMKSIDYTDSETMNQTLESIEKTDSETMNQTSEKIEKTDSETMNQTLENIGKTDSKTMNQNLPKLKDLEEEVERLKVEIETVCTQKKELEEQFECKSDEATEMKDRITRLEAQIQEIEASSKENESQFHYLKKQCEDNEKHYLSRISDLSAQANDLQNEVNSLQAQKGELEERVSHEIRKKYSKVKNVMHHVNVLQQKLVSVGRERSKLEMELKNKSDEVTDSLIQIQFLKTELAKSRGSTAEEGLKVRIKDLELEIQSLISNKRNLEGRMKKIIHDASQSKWDLNVKINELQTALSQKENQILAVEKKFKDSEKGVSAQINFWRDQVGILENKLHEERKKVQMELESLQKERQQLEMELEKEKEEGLAIKSQMEKKNTELSNKLSDQQKTLLELGEALNKLKGENESLYQTKFLDSKSNFNLVEKKIEEMAEELRKQFEDKYRILSRRIRVAEQLHVENKEWYRKTREAYEEETKELKELLGKSECGLKDVKDMSIAANDVLTSLDPVALRFEECTANFLNRISKASCELKFAKDWAMRKNKALLHVRDDLECILAQLDDKEAEILVFREKIWKSENKVRELEKMIKEKEDGMLVLKEEKREAIRQLCVWIDYHRSRSDYYKKLLTDMNLGRRKTS